MRAAVVMAVGGGVEVRDDVEWTGPGPGEVRVRIGASGICHTDFGVTTGVTGTGLPCVLGHEGAGEVIALGAGVEHLRLGAHVITAWSAPCGRCSFCLGGQANLCFNRPRSTSQLTVGGQRAFPALGVGTLCEEVVIPAAAAIPIPDDVPFEIGALVGCGVTTGVGAALNTAEVKPGSTVVVLGCGGVGINTIQGAKVAGAAVIVGVDLLPAKHELALQFGATHGATPADLPGLVASLTGDAGGFDYAFECVGAPALVNQAWGLVRRGGTVVLVGSQRPGDTVTFDAFDLYIWEKKLFGCLYGSSDVRSEFARILRLWRNGQLDLEPLVTARGTLHDVQRAFDDMERGDGLRTVVVP